MIKAFKFGDFRIIGKAKDIPELIAAMAASRGQYQRWKDEQSKKAQE